MRNSTLYKISGTKTYRLSSAQILPRKMLVLGKTVKKGFGSNLQNIEKSMRSIYVPDDGMIFVQTDQSGAEALIVAYLCRDADYRQLFLNGVKPHVYVAMKLFWDEWPKRMKDAGLLSSSDDINNLVALNETRIQDLKKNPIWKGLDGVIKDSDNWSLQERFYYLAKQTCHSANYGISAPTFQMNVLEKSGGKIVLSREEADRFLTVYRGLFQEISEWHERVSVMVEKDKVIYNLHGHPYIITAANFRESDIKEYYAWAPQSTVGEITNIAYTRLQNYIEICCYKGVRVPAPLSEEVVQALDEYGSSYFKADLLANTHDSYMGQCLIDEVVRFGKLQKFFIEQSFVSPVDGTKFAMKSETAAGFNWSSFKAGKNTQGLKELKV